MGIEEVLKAYTPTENEDSDGFEILKGTYRCTVSRLAVGETKKDPKMPRYELELVIAEVLEGNGNPGRKLWRNYQKDDEKAFKKLLNDLFTAEIKLSTASIADFENTFFAAIEAQVTVRAWGWTPDKALDGTPIPVEERVTMQQFKIVSPAKVKVKAKSASEVPF